MLRRVSQGLMLGCVLLTGEWVFAQAPGNVAPDVAMDRRQYWRDSTFGATEGYWVDYWNWYDRQLSPYYGRRVPYGNGTPYYGRNEIGYSWRDYVTGANQNVRVPPVHANAGVEANAAAVNHPPMAHRPEPYTTVIEGDHLIRDESLTPSRIEPPGATTGFRAYPTTYPDYTDIYSRPRNPTYLNPATRSPGQPVGRWY